MPEKSKLRKWRNERALRGKPIKKLGRELELPHFGWLPKIKYVQIQTHSRCNADCVFCPYIESAHAKNHGRMEDKVWELSMHNLVPFKETIEEGKICPYLMQEPLIDKTIFDKIEDIYKYFPKTTVEISTNGAALTESTVEKLLAKFEGRKHDLWVSHHGIDKFTFEHIMKIDYDKATSNLLNLLKVANGKFNIRIRGAGESACVSQVYFSREQYLAYWDKKLEENGIARTNIEIDAFRFHDRAGTLHREDRGANKLNLGVIREINPRNPFYCTRVDEWVHIMWNGDLRLCCMDYHGEVKLPNIMQTSLIEYFQGSEYYELVEQISGRKGCLPGHICTRCVSPGG